MQHLDGPVAGADVAELERGRTGGARRAAIAGHRRRCRALVLLGLAKVRRPHGVVALHLGRCPDRDDAAEVEHVDPFASAHDERHVVLDEEHRQSRAGDLAQQRAEGCGLGLVESRRRLVEQQHARLRRECPSQLDEARRTGREPVDAVFGHCLQSDPLENLVGDHGRGPLPIVRPSASHLRRHEDVLPRGQAPERLEPLERAADPEPGPLMGLAARDVATVELDPARVRPEQPGDDVEQRRLARPVGADQPGDVTDLDVDRHLAEGLQAAEADRHLAYVEEGHLRSVPSS